MVSMMSDTKESSIVCSEGASASTQHAAEVQCPRLPSNCTQQLQQLKQQTSKQIITITQDKSMATTWQQRPETATHQF
jgi:hypothetical protein